MAFRTKIYLFMMVITSILILSACFHQKTPVEKMYDGLENVVTAEKEFEEQQDPLVALEKNEKEVYDKIIGLGMKQYDQIVKLSNDAISMADKRKDHMEKETLSIEKSKKTFEKILKIKEKIDDPDIKKQANLLYSVMMQRYKAHDTLNKEYLMGIKNDKKLYELFKDKNISLEDLENQVNISNETYQKIFNANEKFNKLTKEYNEEKLKFYKKANLK